MPSVSRAAFISPNRPLRRAFYERVSTDEQSERDTIRAQDKALHRAYDCLFADDAKEHSVFVGTFRDDGVSGTIPMDQRPQGSRMMALVRRGEIDIVCVARSDRLARDRGVAEALAEEFYGRGIGIESPNEHIDLTTPQGRLQFAIMCAFSHYERELIRDRTMGGRATHTENGEFINGPIPFGYDVKDGRLVPSTHVIEQLGMTEAEVAVTIFERCATGESLLSIMRWLRAAGVPSIKRYYSKKKEKYTEKVFPLWQHSRLLDMVDSTIYYGERVLKYNKPGSTKYGAIPSPIAQSVPALVTRELWDRARQAKSGHVSNYETERPENYTYLLTGKVVCGACGSNMLGNFQKRKARSYYICSRTRGRNLARKPGVVCAAPMYINGAKLEELILGRLDEIVADPAPIVASIRARQIEQHGGTTDQHEARQRALRQRLAGFERGRAGLVALVRSGELTAEEFTAQTAEHAREAAEVRRELDLIEDEQSLAEALLDQLRDAEHLLQMLQEQWSNVRTVDYPRAALREFLKPLIQRIVVNTDRSVDCTILADNRSTDSGKLLDYISIGRPGFVFSASLLPIAS